MGISKLLFTLTALVTAALCRTTTTDLFATLSRTAEFVVNPIADQMVAGLGFVHDTNAGTRICNWNSPLNQGVCYDPAVCWALGGNFVGFAKPLCAGLPQFSQCCMFVYGCDRESEQTLSYFQGRDTIVHDHVPCSLTVRGRLGACQLRVDIVDLVLKDPDPQGRCDQNSQMEIHSFGKTVLCGNNTGTHLYLPLAENEKIRFELRHRGGERLNWLVRLIQVDCRANRKSRLLADLKAPEGCLQYFIRPQGFVKSFNFSPKGSMPGNSEYSVCFRQGRNHCGLELRRRTFKLGVNDEPCTGCYVGSVGLATSAMQPINSERLCGSMEDAVRVTSRPFMMRVKTKQEPDDSKFFLFYKMVEC